MGNNEIQLNTPKDTSNLLKETFSSLVEGLTGILSSEKKVLITSVGHILQCLRSGQFLSKLITEWNEYRAKGRIKDDYQDTEQHKACLQELLNSLDKDMPDETRFTILKKIFLVAATEKVSDRNSHLPLQFMQICRTLSSAEVIILNTAYEIAKSKKFEVAQKNIEVMDWFNEIAAKSGLTHPELVEMHEEALAKKCLISKRRTNIGIYCGKYFRLTELGYRICNYIENYTE